MKFINRNWMLCLLNKFVLVTVLAATFLLAGCGVIDRVFRQPENIPNKTDVKSSEHVSAPECMPAGSDTYDILGHC